MPLCWCVCIVFSLHLARVECLHIKSYLNCHDNLHLHFPSLPIHQMSAVFLLSLQIVTLQSAPVITSFPSPELPRLSPHLQLIPSSTTHMYTSPAPLFLCLFVKVTMCLIPLRASHLDLDLDLYLMCSFLLLVQYISEFRPASCLSAACLHRPTGFLCLFRLPSWCWPLPASRSCKPLALVFINKSLNDPVCLLLSAFGSYPCCLYSPAMTLTCQVPDIQGRSQQCCQLLSERA